MNIIGAGDLWHGDDGDDISSGLYFDYNRPENSPEKARSSNPFIRVDKKRKLTQCLAL
jgi:hypothetical protein